MSTSPIQSDALAALRVQIDQLDAELLRLLNDRAKVAQEVGDIKRAEGSPFFRPDRVSQVIEKITQANAGPLKNEHVASIWREIMSACLALEAPQRVAVLGPQGTFCEQAAIEFFGSAADLTYCAMYRGKRFQVRPLAEILSDIAEAPAVGAGWGENFGAGGVVRPESSSGFFIERFTSEVVLSPRFFFTLSIARETMPRFEQ